MTAEGPTLDDARRELYAGPRATFVERRKDLAGAARRRGDRDQAKLIGEMRKPSAAAHVVNLLAQADDAGLQELVELGTSIRGAMADGDDGAVRSLLQGRAAAIAKVVAQAKKVARADGEPMSAATGDQLTQTLRAAMASDDAAAAVRGGTLTDALDASGFDGVNIAPTARTPSPKKPGTEKPAPKADPTADRAADAAAMAAARAAAQARAKTAAAELQRAEKELAGATKRRDALARDRDRVAAQLAQLEDDLTAAEAHVHELETKRADAATELKAARGTEPQFRT